MKIIAAKMCEMEMYETKVNGTKIIAVKMSEMKINKRRRCTNE